jgi:hypothetical protein
MELSLWITNSLSLTVVFSCWWLAHQYARIKPPGRAIAAILSLLGLATMFTMFARNFDVALAWPIIVQKALLSICFLLIIVRRTRKERDA